MKILRNVLLAIVLLVVIILALVMVRGGTIIREAVNSAGPKVLGVPVRVKDVSFRPLNGHVRLEGLHVGNPAGYKTDGVFEMGLVEVILKPASLFSDTIVIEKVKIESPQITYERGLKNSNIGALLDQLGGEKKDDGGKKPEDKPTGGEKPQAEAGGKKVIIRDVQVNGAQVKVSVTALQGLAAPVPLPPVHVTGIGEDTGGTSVVDALTKILGAVLGAVTDVVVGAGKLVGDGVTAVGGVAVDGAKAVGGVVGGAAGKVTDGIGGLFKGKGEKKK